MLRLGFQHMNLRRDTIQPITHVTTFILTNNYMTLRKRAPSLDLRVFRKKGDHDCSCSQDCGSPGGQGAACPNWIGWDGNRSGFTFSVQTSTWKQNHLLTLPSVLLVASPLFSSAAVPAHELCFSTSSAAAPHVVPSPLPGWHPPLLPSSQYVSSCRHCRFSHLAARSSSDLVTPWPTGTSSLPFPGLPRSPRTSMAQRRRFSPGLHITPRPWVLDCTLSSSPCHVPY